MSGDVEAVLAELDEAALASRSLADHMLATLDKNPGNRGEWIRLDVRAEALADAAAWATETAAGVAGCRMTAKRKSRVYTGRCHTCDRAISGERQFCGPCLAKRLDNRNTPSPSPAPIPMRDG